MKEQEIIDGFEHHPLFKRRTNGGGGGRAGGYDGNGGAGGNANLHFYGQNYVYLNQWLHLRPFLKTILEA